MIIDKSWMGRKSESFLGAFLLYILLTSPTFELETFATRTNGARERGFRKAFDQKWGHGMGCFMLA